MRNIMWKKGALVLGVMSAGMAWADYVIFDLGTLGGTISVANSINNNGDIVGASRLAGDTVQHAFLYQNGVMIDIDSRVSMNSTATKINNSAQVVGVEWGSPLPGTGNDNQPFLYSGGTRTTLPIVEYFGGTASQALGINDSGQIVGFLAMSVGNGTHQAYRYSGGTQTDLGTLGTALFNSFAYAINNSGHIVGMANNASGSNNAFLYVNGVKTDLGTLGGTWNTRATDINENGKIVGVSAVSTSNTNQHAFVYNNSVMSDLGTLGGIYSAAWAINVHDQIVGDSRTASGEQHAFLYDSNGMHDLNDLLPPDSGWVLISARDINDDGLIVGVGDIDGERHAYLMGPGCGE